MCEGFDVARYQSRNAPDSLKAFDVLGANVASIGNAMASACSRRRSIAVAAPALAGALIEGLVGPLAASTGDDAVKMRDAVQTLTLFALRAVGVVDAHARGLVVQTRMPVRERVGVG